VKTGVNGHIYVYGNVAVIARCFCV